MNEVAQIRKLINQAEVIIIGAGAGLSAASGFEYGGETFINNFPEMHQKYGYDDMYSASFHNFASDEEKWGFWSKMIYLNRFKDGPKPLYQKLYNIVKNKDYFVITTNVDHQFILASFDKKRLFYTQGDYGLFQCSLPCQNETFDNEEIIKQMVAKQIDGKIPSSLIPRCPFCGRKLTTNLRSDDHFVEDEGWHQALERYQTFIEKNKDKKILFLELGVGWNTPGIIKYPFMQMTKKFKNSFYLCINQGQNYCFDEIQERSLILNEDLNILLEL